MKKDEEGCGKGKKKDGGVWNMNEEILIGMWQRKEERWRGVEYECRKMKMDVAKERRKMEGCGI